MLPWESCIKWICKLPGITGSGSSWRKNLRRLIAEGTSASLTKSTSSPLSYLCRSHSTVSAFPLTWKSPCCSRPPTLVQGNYSVSCKVNCLTIYIHSPINLKYSYFWKAFLGSHDLTKNLQIIHLETHYLCSKGYSILSHPLYPLKIFLSPPVKLVLGWATVISKYTNLSKNHTKILKRISSFSCFGLFIQKKKIKNPRSKRGKLCLLKQKLALKVRKCIPCSSI